MMMKLDRTVIRKGDMQTFQDDGFVHTTMKRRVEMVWDMTLALWAMSTRGKIHAESRLQRDVAVFRRIKG